MMVGIGRSGFVVENTKSDPIWHILSQHYLFSSAIVDPNDPDP